MTIAAVSTAVSSYNSTASHTSYTVAHTNTTAGDYLVLTINIGNNISSDPVTGVSGGGVTTWTKAASHAGGGVNHIWYGKITTTGSQTTTVTTSATQYGTLCVEEFSTTVGTILVATSNFNSNASSTTVACPSLTPARGTMLYVGTAVSSGTTDHLTAGSTSGYTYAVAGTSSYEGGICYNASVTAASAPSFSQASLSTTSASLGVLFYEPNTYYVSAAGSDSANGLTTSTPWLTITHVNTISYLPGDSINFRGGDTFNDAQLYLPESGNSSNSILVTSYNGSNATLANASTSSDAVYIYDAAYITIQNLNISTAAGFASVKNGIEFYGDNAQYAGIIIQNCTITGYINGIIIGGAGNNEGTNGIQILNNTIHNNRDFGIQLYGPGTFVASQFQHLNPVITGNTCYSQAGNTTNTTSATGYGLALGGLSGGTVSQNVAYSNGASNGYTSGGPVGIMVYDSNGVTVSNCVAYSNSSGTSADGDGIDLDVNTSNSIVEYCISYNNKGSGILLWNTTTTNWTGNTVRYNVCWGNATGNAYAEIFVGGTASSSNIYQNTCISKASNPAVYLNNTGTKTSIAFYNNIFVVTGTPSVVTGATNFATTAVNFNGNLYYSAGTFSIIWGANTRTSVSSWEASDGQEMHSSVGVGIQANPQLVDFISQPTVTVSGSLTPANGMRMLNLSPANGTGMNLSTVFSISRGSVDFFGTTLPAGYSVGAVSSTGYPISSFMEFFNIL